MQAQPFLAGQQTFSARHAQAREKEIAKVSPQTHLLPLAGRNA